MKKAFRLLSKQLQDIIESHDFSIYFCGNGTYEFGKYSSEGQDFNFTVDIGNNIRDFANNILRYWEDFDPSEEASLWLDDTGHGTNGAPYAMIDVYNDMVECKGFIYELYEIVMDYWG